MIRLTDEQWERIRMYFPEEHIPDCRPGRKPIPTRRVLEAVLWILNTGAQWHMLPQSYPNYKTVHRRFQTSSASSPGFNGSAGSSFAGSTTPTTSSALSNLPASSSSSNDFEIGSSHSLARARVGCRIIGRKCQEGQRPARLRGCVAHAGALSS